MLQEARRRIDAMHPSFRDTPASLRAAVYARCSVSHRNAYIYFRVPKAANSTVSKILAWQTFPEERAAIEADDDGRAAKRLFAHYPWTWLTPDSASGYFKFMFVRNPYSRVLSAYLDKINPGFQRPAFAYVGASLGKSSADLRFGEFISYLENGGLRTDVHWAPQLDLCPIPVSKLDFVGKIESLEADLGHVVQRVFDRPLAMDRQRTSRRTNSSGKMQAYYTPELVDRVANLYRDDFDSFGYDLRLPRAAQ